MTLQKLCPYCSGKLTKKTVYSFLWKLFSLFSGRKSSKMKTVVSKNAFSCYEHHTQTEGGGINLNAQCLKTWPNKTKTI